MVLCHPTDCNPPGFSINGIFQARTLEWVAIFFLFFWGGGFHFLLEGIFPPQGSNSGLPHCRQTLYPLSHQGIPSLMAIVTS